MEKKIISKAKFIFDIIISFIIWNFVISILGKLTVSLINKIISNDIITTFVSYTFWILKSILIIFLCYLNNKNKRVAKYELEKTKIIILIMFYVFIIGLSMLDITYGVIQNPIVWIPLIIIHMFLIALFNDIMFRRCIYYEKK